MLYMRRTKEKECYEDVPAGPIFWVMQITEDLLPKNLQLLFTFGSDLRIWSRLLKQMVDKTLTVLDLGSLQN